jgi:hypothetical protein
LDLFCKFLVVRQAAASAVPWPRSLSWSQDREIRPAWSAAALDGAQPIGPTEITFDIGDKAIELPRVALCERRRAGFARLSSWQPVGNWVVSATRLFFGVATPHEQLMVQTWGLFLAVLFDVRLRCLFGMSSGVSDMTPRRMSMVCRFLVTSGLVMLGRFRVVACGVGMMF